MGYQLLNRRGALNEACAPAARPAPINPANLTWANVPPEVVELVPETVARENVVMPLGFDGETITLAAADPDDIALADKVRFLTGKNVRLVKAPRETIMQAIDRHYGHTESESVASLLREFTDTAVDWKDEDLCLSEATEAPAPARRMLKRRPVADLVRTLSTPSRPGLDPITNRGVQGMFFYTVEEGQRVLMRRPDGTMEVLVGPRRVWRGRNTFEPMQHYVAHPDEFLVVRYRDGRQEHLPGPVEVWFDPRVHLHVTRQEALQLAAKEAVVVYSRAEGTDVVARRLVFGPALFVPRPGEWLHTFSWHASRGGSRGVQKVPGGLVFQKLWLMPDQMYHDVTDVRTADDAVLTVRLMIFFELVSIERMLDATHDPIGDFVNAATSDVVAFTAQHDFEQFKRNTGRLNELETYPQLVGRAAQCGYRINKVVYRGYGAAEALQQMHDQAIQARTRLQLDRATEQQAQDLENYKLDAQLARAGKRRSEQAVEVEHDLALARKRQEEEARRREAEQTAQRESRRLEAERQLDLRRRQDAAQREHLEALKQLGVDLTAYLTQARADQVIEFRGAGRPHVHLDKPRAESRNGGGSQ